MKRSVLSVILVIITFYTGIAQDDLFGTQKQAVRKGWLIGVNGDVDWPAADMAKRFGHSYRLGPAVSYKTNKNWIFGVKGDFIIGNKIKEDSFLINLRDNEGYMLNSNGQSQRVSTYERGYTVALEAGKIINLKKNKNSDNGILFLTSVGFMQYKINLFNRDEDLPQVRGDYKKGYDRLTNGIFIEEHIGYCYFANNALVNFHIGLDIMAGFNKGRRDYLLDVMRPDDKSRVDILFGIRGGWYIPIFKRKSEELFFQ